MNRQTKRIIWVLGIVMALGVCLAASVQAAVTLEQSVSASGTKANTLTLPSWTPGANQLVLVVIVTRDVSDIPSSVQGNGITFTNVLSFADGQDVFRVTVWRGMSASPTTGAITFSWGEATTTRGWAAVASRFSGVDTSGTNGSGAIEASASANQGATDSTNSSVNITTLTNNAWAWAVYADRARTMTYGSGVNQIVANIIGGEGGDVATAYTGYKAVATAGETTMDGTWNSATDWAVGAISIKPAGAANNAPNTPSNSSPSNGAGVSTLTPTLTSSAFSDPDSGDTHSASQWQITAASGNYSSPVWDSGTDTTNKTSVVVPGGNLSASTTYYWHVRHQDNNAAWSNYSTETNFSTPANNAPNTPSNSSPSNGAGVSTLAPTLTSSAFSDPDSGDTHSASQWQITATSGNYSSPVWDSGTDTSNKTSVVVPGGNLSASTTYYWHVRHQDNNAAWSNYSTETNFSTPANNAPNTPSNTSPSNGASVATLTPTLTSSAFSDSDSGDTHSASQWQITATSGNYSSPVWDSGTDTTNKTSVVVPGGNLSASTTYYWHVRHRDNSSAWSNYSTETNFYDSYVQPVGYTSDANMVSWWYLDEASGTRYDGSSNNNDLLENNGPVAVSTSSAQGARCASFDATNDRFLYINDANQTGLDITGNLTIMGWCKANSFSETIIIAGKDGSSPDNGYYIRLQSGSPGKAVFIVSADGSNGTSVSSASDALTETGVWYHVAGVYNGSNLYVYVNGQQYGPTSFSSGICNNSAAFNIGARASNAQEFNGSIDEVAVFNRALSTAEIQDIYENGLDGKRWWDYNYKYRKRITFTNNYGSTVSTSTIAGFKTNTSALVSASQVRSDAKDWRIVHLGTDLARDVYYDWNGSNTDTWFRLQAPIANTATDNRYFVYYGYSSEAGTPSSLGLSEGILVQQLSGDGQTDIAIDWNNTTEWGAAQAYSYNPANTSYYVVTKFSFYCNNRGATSSSLMAGYIFDGVNKHDGQQITNGKSNTFANSSVLASAWNDASFSVPHPRPVRSVARYMAVLPDSARAASGGYFRWNWAAGMYNGAYEVPQSGNWDKSNIATDADYTYKLYGYEAPNDLCAYSVGGVESLAPDAPSKITIASGAAIVNLTIAWQDNSTNETNFVVEKSTDGGGFSTYQTLGAGVTSTTDTGAAGHTYQYRVKATNADGSSSYATSTTLSIQSGNVNIEGLKIEGIKIN